MKLPAICLDREAPEFVLVRELYEVDEHVLAKLDQIESIGQPGNFRERVKVEPNAGGSTISAFAYMKARSLAEPAHSGYLDSYDDQRFIPPTDESGGV